MTTFVVLGDAQAAKKLVRATLNDYLDTDILNDDEMHVVVGQRKKPTDTLATVMDWCEVASSYEIVTPGGGEGRDSALEHYECEFPLIEAVERGYGYSGDSTVVLALVGEDQPKADVARALARAADSHMVIRDLTEGALTFIKFHGDSADEPPSEETEMAAAEEEQEVTLEELVEWADDVEHENAEEAATALDEAAREAGIDPDEYATWAEVGELLAEALGDEEEEEEPEEEEPEEEPEEEESESGWTAEALKGMTLKEVREHAKAAGVPNASKAPRAALVQALVEGTGDTSEEEEEPKQKDKGKSSPKAAAPAGDLDYGVLAKAIVDELVSRLS